MSSYTAVCRSSRAAREENDCAVKAVAIATKEKYDLIRGMMLQAGRSAGHETPGDIIRDVLEKLGYGMIDVPLRNFRGKMLPVIVRQLDKEKTYFVWTACHILCVKRGKCEDWTAGQRLKVTKVALCEKAVCEVCGTPCLNSYPKPPEDWKTSPRWMRSFALSSHYNLRAIAGLRATQHALCGPCVCVMWEIPDELQYRYIRR